MSGNTAVLTWDKPTRRQTIEEWKGITADSAPPGVYTPNMSESDRAKWKAKLVGKTTDKMRVEIRKSFGPVQALIVVDLYTVKLSMNGAARFNAREWAELGLAVFEAREAMTLYLGEREEVAPTPE